MASLNFSGLLSSSMHPAFYVVRHSCDEPAAAPPAIHFPHLDITLTSARFLHSLGRLRIFLPPPPRLASASTYTHIPLPAQITAAPSLPFVRSLAHRFSARRSPHGTTEASFFFFAGRAAGERLQVMLKEEAGMW